MLVDHHCHIDRPEFAQGLGWRGRACARGGCGRHGQHLDAHPQVRSPDLGRGALSRAFTARSARILTTRTRSWTFPTSEIVRLSKHPKIVGIGEAGLDYYYKHSTPEAQAQGFRNHIAAARETGLPLEIHTREADVGHDQDPRGGARQGPVPGDPALLHGRAGAGAAGGRARALRVVHRRRDVQEVGGFARDRLRCSARSVAGRDRRALSRARALSRQAERAGLCRAHGRGAGRGARHSAAELARATTENFFRIYTKVPRAASQGLCRRMSLRITILGCGSSGGVPRIGSMWGQCDPSQPEEQAAAVLDPGRAAEQRRAQRQCWSIRRRICASSSCRCAAIISTACCSRTTTPTTRTASTTCAWSPTP